MTSNAKEKTGEILGFPRIFYVSEMKIIQGKTDYTDCDELLTRVEKPGHKIHQQQSPAV